MTHPTSNLVSRIDRLVSKLLDWTEHDHAALRRSAASLLRDAQAEIVRQSPVETTTSAWLIEMAGKRAEPLYWHAEPDMRCLGGFDPDVNKAMRFCREKDARAMALMLSAKGMIAIADVRRVRITEHEWHSSAEETKPRQCGHSTTDADCTLTWCGSTLDPAANTHHYICAVCGGHFDLPLSSAQKASTEGPSKGATSHEKTEGRTLTSTQVGVANARLGCAYGAKLAPFDGSSENGKANEVTR